MKHIIDRVLELQEDEIAAQNTPEPVEDLNLQDLLKSLQPKIRVFGCGGAGSNAVARLEAESLFDDEYVKGMAINTDAQHLLKVAVENKILIGRTARGRGAGGDPEKGEQGDTGLEDLSRAAAVILLAIYMLFLFFQLRTHSELFATDDTHEHEESSMTMKEAIILLVISTILVSWMAEILVHSLEEAAEEVNMSHLFIGVILLPMFGNAAEHFTAVSVAGKNKMDLSFAIAIGSSTQIAVFVAPLMVITAWALGLPLTFEFGLLETVAAFLAVLIANAIASDGKSNWLEGAMLLGTYAVLALAFWFHP